MPIGGVVGVPLSAGCTWLRESLVLAGHTALEVLGTVVPRPGPGILRITGQD